jgi:hypothetical protein
VIPKLVELLQTHVALHTDDAYLLEGTAGLVNANFAGGFFGYPLRTRVLGPLTPKDDMLVVNVTAKGRGKKKEFSRQVDIGYVLMAGPMEDAAFRLKQQSTFVELFNEGAISVSQLLAAPPPKLLAYLTSIDKLNMNVALNDAHRRVLFASGVRGNDISNIADIDNLLTAQNKAHKAAKKAGGLKAGNVDASLAADNTMRHGLEEKLRRDAAIAEGIKSLFTVQEVLMNLAFESGSLYGFVDIVDDLAKFAKHFPELFDIGRSPCLSGDLNPIGVRYIESTDHSGSVMMPFRKDHVSIPSLQTIEGTIAESTLKRLFSKKESKATKQYRADQLIPALSSTSFGAARTPASHRHAPSFPQQSKEQHSVRKDAHATTFLVWRATNMDDLQNPCQQTVTVGNDVIHGQVWQLQQRVTIPAVVGGEAVVLDSLSWVIVDKFSKQKAENVIVCADEGRAVPHGAFSCNFQKFVAPDEFEDPPEAD